MKNLKNLTTGVFALTLAINVASVSTAAENPKKDENNSNTAITHVLELAQAKAEHLDDLQKFQTLENVAVSYAQINDFENALKVANSITAESHKINAYLWISRIYRSKGNDTESKELLFATLAIASKLSTSIYKAELYEDISNELLNFGETTIANGVKVQSKKILERLESKVSAK